MSLATTKDHLIKLLGDKENKVIALSGKWGTGKSHLWDEVKAASMDEGVKNTLSVSLFGIKNIDEIKMKLCSQAYKVNPKFYEPIKKALGSALDFAGNFFQGVSTVKAWPILAAPLVLKNKRIVLDDIERKHANLSVDEVLGFIDEYVKEEQGARFVLILNSGQLEDLETWNEMREKVIDQELQLDTTPEEAFAIAAKLIQPKHTDGAHIKKAVVICEISNIRIIKKIIRVINSILEGHENLTDEVLARVIPSTVLLSAIHYKGIDDGLDFDFVLKGAIQHLYGSRNQNDDVENSPQHAKWRSMLTQLGIYGCDEFETLICDYLKSGMFEVEAVSKIINGYVNDKKILEIKNQLHQLFQDICWNNKPDPELITEAKLFVANSHYIDAYNITALYDLLNEYFAEADGVTDELIHHWIEKCKDQSRLFQNFDDDPFGRPLHPLIKQMIAERKAKAISNTMFADALENFVYKSSWSNEELARIKSATTQDFESVFMSLDNKMKSLTVSKFLGYCGSINQNETVIGGASNRFIEACRNICASTNPQLRRLGVTIKGQFTSAEKANLLEPSNSVVDHLATKAEYLPSTPTNCP